MKDSTPAYLIASSIMPADHGSLMPYYEAAHALIEKSGAEVLVAGEVNQALHHLEGEWAKDAALTIFKFPSMKALLDFYNAPEYQAIKHLRTDVIKPNFAFAVEGFVDDGTNRYLDK